MLTVIFTHLDKRGSIPACWRSADVVPASKVTVSSDVGEYSPISVTPLISKVFEKIIAGKLSHSLEGTSRLSFCIKRAWEYAMLCPHCITIYRLP